MAILEKIIVGAQKVYLVSTLRHFLPGKRFFVCLALVLLAVTFAVSGCGKKGPPLPAKSSMPPAVTGLTATVDGNNILLRWRIETSGNKEPAGFMIYRGDVVCPACPVKYRPVARLPYRSEPGFTFTDTPGRSGHFTYRIRCVDAYGIQGPIAITDAVLPEEAK